MKIMMRYLVIGAIIAALLFIGYGIFEAVKINQSEANQNLQLYEDSLGRAAEEGKDMQVPAKRIKQ